MKLFDLQRRFGLRGAPNFIMAILALLVFEGIIKTYYGELDFQRAAQPFLLKALFPPRPHFTRRTSGYLSLRRTPIQATGQYTGYYLFQEAVVTFEHKVTPNLTGRAEIAFRNSNFPGSEKPFSAAFTLNEISGLFELRYRPGTPDRPGPLVFTVGYTPSRSTSTQPGLDINSQRLRVGLQYGWF